MRPLTPAVLLCALAVLAVAPAAAQPAAPTARPPVQAVRARQPLVIDGAIDDAAWNGAPVTDGFIQADPDQGAPSRQRTEVRVLYDDHALYVGARMFDTSPDSIVARLARRDDDSRSDLFALYLDPFHDKRTGYYFAVTAAGSLLDGTLYNDGWEDDSWDGVWDARVRRDDRGWTAEMRIPLSQLRYTVTPPIVWGVNFQRNLNRGAEDSRLVYTPRGQSGYVSRFPELHGLAGLRAGRVLELTPYATAKGEFLAHREGDPFRPDGGRADAAAGGDLRTSLGANLTLNVTLNPDFGQVEVDPAVVNLSDVESFFEEKRPFFVEGATVFRTGNNGADDYWNFNWPEPIFFYSRRVGRTPQGFGGAADFADAPVATRILGAAKVTGRPAPGWNLGTLHALTDREEVRLSTAGVERRATIEPYAYYGVLRGLRELNDRRQGVGMMTTVVNRFFESGDPLRAQMNGTALMTAVDGWTFLDSSRTWVLSGWASGSHMQGSRERITALQRNPVHYLQRPDAGRAGVDTSATALSGHGARLWLNKQNGAVLFNSALGYLSPGFENNDLGFVSRADVLNAHVAGGYQWEQPRGVRQYANAIVGLFTSWDLAGTPQAGGAYLSGSHEFTNRWSSEASANLSPERLSARSTRGGPLMRLPASRSVDLYFDTDGGAPWFWSIAGGFEDDDAGGRRSSAELGFRYRPRSNLRLDFGPRFEDLVNDAQYLKRVDDPTATTTYGARYVFAELAQKTLSAELRVDCSLTPDLSIQLYAQPLVSSGRYTGFKQLARGRTYDFDVYGAGGSTFDPATGTVDPDGAGPAPPFGVGRPDFTFRSVRGNAVLRWQYLPGSTLFLVWTQERAGSDGQGDFTLGRALGDLARTPMSNVFLVKVAHHFEL